MYKVGAFFLCVLMLAIVFEIQAKRIRPGTETLQHLIDPGAPFDQGKVIAIKLIELIAVYCEAFAAAEGPRIFVVNGGADERRKNIRYSFAFRCRFLSSNSRFKWSKMSPFKIRRLNLNCAKTSNRNSALQSSEPK